LVVNAMCFVIMIVLTVARGWAIVGFALGGYVLSASYTAPPLRLKKRGLGEPTVLVVWGPLMVGGTYYAAVGSIPWEVVLASIPYGLLCTAVLMGKHVDKIEADTAKGIHTLPVILGRDRALALTRALIVAFFALVALLVVTGIVGVWALLAFAAVPRARKILAALRMPRPAAPPKGYPLWPLWYVSLAFVVTRSAGSWFVLGLVLDAIVPVHLPRLL